MAVPQAEDRSQAREPGLQITPFDPARPLPWYQNCAIAEYPTDNGPADYALCVDGRILGIVEAKKVTLGLTQAVRAKAFRGELVPTEAELARREGRDYEPAATLLERLQAERLGKWCIKTSKKIHPTAGA